MEGKTKRNFEKYIIYDLTGLQLWEVTQNYDFWNVNNQIWKLTIIV